jgi:hypothetical protein
MTEFVAIIKKYGVTGVLALWLWHTDTRLQKVETALYDCYKEQSFRAGKATNTIHLPAKLLAILPNDEKNYSRYTQA